MDYVSDTWLDCRLWVLHYGFQVRAVFVLYTNDRLFTLDTDMNFRDTFHCRYVTSIGLKNSTDIELIESRRA